jgi:hypothetical protein
LSAWPGIKSAGCGRSRQCHSLRVAESTESGLSRRSSYLRTTEQQLDHDYKSKSDLSILCCRCNRELKQQHRNSQQPPRGKTRNWRPSKEESIRRIGRKRLINLLLHLQLAVERDHSRSSSCRGKTNAARNRFRTAYMGNCRGDYFNSA